MASGDLDVRSPASGTQPAGPPAWRSASIRRWARVGIASQVLFVASWLAAAAWQGPRYSVLSHSISEMYGRTAPHPMFLLIVLTLCGAATILFTFRSVWPALRSGGWAATVGSVLLALSVAGIGNLLTPFERVACRLADPGCTTAGMVSNAGGKLDNALTSIGLLVLVLAGFFLAHAMRRTPGWRAWAWPTRWTAVLFLALAAADALDSGLSGLFERLLAGAAAAAIAVLAVGILQHFRNTGRPERDHALTTPSQPPPGPPERRGWSAGRIVSLVVGSLLAVLSLGLLGGGGIATWATNTQRDAGGYLTSDTRTLATASYAVTSDTLDLGSSAAWVTPDDVLGTLRIRITDSGPSSQVFVGIAPQSAVKTYLTGVNHLETNWAGHTRDVVAVGGAPPAAPADAGIWTAQASGPGTQTLTWHPTSGRWAVVVMNANGSAGVAVTADAGASVPDLGWIAVGLFAAGGILLAAAAVLIAMPVARARR